MKHAFDILDVLHYSGNVTKLAKFECIDSGLVFPRAHKKQESIWYKLNFMHGKPNWEPNWDWFRLCYILYRRRY